MGHPAFVAGVAKTMLRPLDSILNRRVLTQTLKPSSLRYVGTARLKRALIQSMSFGSL
jgi:hypothetical protein